MKMKGKKINKRLLGIIFISFGAGVLSCVIFPCVGFFMGLLFVALGALEFFC